MSPSDMVLAGEDAMSTPEWRWVEIEEVEDARLQQVHFRCNFVDAASARCDRDERDRRHARRLHYFLLASACFMLWLLVRLAFGWYRHVYFLDTTAVRSRPAKSATQMDNMHCTADEAATPLFNWTAHIPSKTLNWTECYGTFQCARLTVPLDYSDPSGEEAAVALVKSASKYPPDHESYRGPILFNPGGPGGSGVALVLLESEALRTALGEGFDLIGFDPRGVGMTTPRLSIFKTPLEAGTFYMQQEMNMNATLSSLGDAYARSHILGKLAADRAGVVVEHMSTPTVARDMLRIVEASGQDKLQYWGFSYGTVLGATFAAMFPDKVGRMIIDGVEDPDDYYQGLWSNNLRDTDAALLDIYQACVEVGPHKCSLYEPSVALIQARVHALLENIRVAPIPLYDASTSTYDTVDYALVRTLMLSALYQTHQGGAILMDALAALERGDGAPAYARSLRSIFSLFMTCDCAGELPVPSGGLFETLAAIGCGDSVDRDDSIEDVREAYEKMAEMSNFAETWYPRSQCAGWKIRAKHRFNGSFEQNTSFPLLIIGNVADPVTPLWNAHKVAKGFKGSVVLTQNSSGHCSISASSLCTLKAVRGYLIDGILPAEGTVCQVESSIFGTSQGLDSRTAETLSAEDRALLEASRALQESYFVPMAGMNVIDRKLRGGY
ncbi:hypothetical protein M0805_005920 [Coniferiporia weirii]|nr:hypothetical protein M0805_005920 [Coniferiporia weirii]